MTLTKFLNARLGEDEAVAREAHYDGQRWYAEEEVVNGDVDYGPTLVLDRKCDALHSARWSPARVLAEVEAKRDLIAMADPNDYWDDGGNGMSAHADDILRLLALPYADHPDYDEAWRP